MKGLIVDDERIARQELRRLLQAHSEIEICGEARSGAEALACIRRQAPEVLFLDIQMPGMTAFDLLENLEDLPQIIFTTAFDSYALRAFDAGAIDYLVKPVAPNRLAAAISRLRPPVPASSLQRVFVKESDRCWLIQTTDIYLLESEGNYTRLYFGNERALIPRSLSALENRLDSSVFFRASRRHLVNLRWVAAVEADVVGGLLIRLKPGIHVEMSRRRAALFRQALSL